MNNAEHRHNNHSLRVFVNFMPGWIPGSVLTKHLFRAAQDFSRMRREWNGVCLATSCLLTANSEGELEGKGERAP